MPVVKTLNQRRPRMLELFCGIGGAAVAAECRFETVAATDIDQAAIETVEMNFGHPTRVAHFPSIPDEWLMAQEAELWWASPPCQPHTRRGRQRDIEDVRSEALLDLQQRIRRFLPACLAIENVPEFGHSKMRDQLCATLDRCGYSLLELYLCPTQFGFPMRRRRYFLVASRLGLVRLPKIGGDFRMLDGFLWRLGDGCESLRNLPWDGWDVGYPMADLPAELEVPADQRRRFAAAMHVVVQEDPTAVTRCFTSAYGHSPTGAGSYLSTAGRLRRFLPEELLRLFGFPDDFRFPTRLAMRRRWKLVGNSLSIPVVRYILQAFTNTQEVR